MTFFVVLNYMKKVLLLCLFLFSCAKPSTDSNPNNSYFSAYQKYSTSLGQFIDWNGLYFFFASQTFTVYYQSIDFSCRGQANYLADRLVSLPTVVGDQVTISGNLMDSTSCANTYTSITIKLLGVDPADNKNYYSVVLNAEEYYIKK